MRHYRIVNRFRFITFLTVCILIAGIAIIGSLNLVLAEASTQPQYIELEVAEGDTLWNIAAKYCTNNADIRENIYNICKLNNISASDLKAGQTILIKID